MSTINRNLLNLIGLDDDLEQLLHIDILDDPDEENMELQDIPEELPILPLRGLVEIGRAHV